MAVPEGLAVAGAASGVTSATVGTAAAATAAPTTTVLPGTMSPAMIAAIARVNLHGANRLASSTLGSAMVAAVAEAYAENGIGYALTDAGNAGSLVV